MMTHTDHARLFFVHVPKCAGMTLHAIIESQYEPEEIFTVPSVAWNDQNYRALCDEWTPEQRARIKVVKGHMPFGWHAAFGGDDFEYITVLRHPVERVLSFFAHVGEWHPDYIHKEGGLPHFVRFAAEAQNEATYMLSGGRGRGTRAYVQAWDNMTRYMPLVGTVEQFDYFVYRCAARYGWQERGYKRVNVTPDRPRRVTGTEERLILERNECDLKLYAYAMRWLGREL